MKTGSPPTSDHHDPIAAPLMPILTASATYSSHRPLRGVTLVTSLGFFVPSGVFPALDRSPSPASALLDVQRTDASDEISSTFKGLISRPVRNRRRNAGIRSPPDLSLLQGSTVRPPSQGWASHDLPATASTDSNVHHLGYLRSPGSSKTEQAYNLTGIWARRPS